MRFSQLCLILKVVYSEEIRGRDRYRKLQKALHYYYALKLRYRKYFNEDKKKFYRNIPAATIALLILVDKYTETAIFLIRINVTNSEEDFFMVK